MTYSIIERLTQELHLLRPEEQIQELLAEIALDFADSKETLLADGDEKPKEEQRHCAHTRDVVAEGLIHPRPNHRRGNHPLLLT